MKYYAGHESTYRRLEAEGETCWDRRAFDDFFMRPFLERALAMIGPPSAGARALEIGCGTGPASCHVAARGYDVVGVDLSPTAIRMAEHSPPSGMCRCGSRSTTSSSCLATRCSI